jgi:hypothetical protein
MANCQWPWASWRTVADGLFVDLETTTRPRPQHFSRARLSDGQCLLVCLFYLLNLMVYAQHADRHRYGYHVPRTNLRDKYYTKLEQEKAAAKEAS